MAQLQSNIKPIPGDLSGTLPSLLFGIPIGISLWALVIFGPIENPTLKRYLGHPVEFVELVMFSTAVTSLVWKYGKIRREKSVLKMKLFPAWDGNQIHPKLAGGILEQLGSTPDWVKNTLVYRRYFELLDFVSKRNCSDGFDDQLRDNADKDIIEFENSFALTRFITWAIPILGFLGTVLGITGAISGVTPEMLEKSMSTVTDGLALSFDATALALGLTMVTMFFSFLVEKSGNGVCEQLDMVAEEEFSHRFLKVQSDQGPFMEILNIQTREVLQSSKDLVANQITLWSHAMNKLQDEGKTQAQMIQESVRSGLEQAMSNSLQAHQKNLENRDIQSIGMAKALADHISGLSVAIKDSGREHLQKISNLSEAMAKQANMLWELQQGEKHLAHIQNMLQENLRLVSATGNFQEAVHCLTAAVHMLTSKMQPKAPEGFSYNSGVGLETRTVPGKAA